MDVVNAGTPPPPTLRDVPGLLGRLYRRELDERYSALVHRDPTSRLRLSEGRLDPYPVYEEMRAAGPVVSTRLGNLATVSHPIANQVLRSRRFGVRTEDGRMTHGGVHDEFDVSFLGQNPPDHTRLRRLAASAFSPRQMTAYADMIDKSVHQLLDAAEAGGSFDLVADFAAPLPIAVITSMMGIPDADAERFRRHGAVVGGALDGVKGLRHGAALFRANSELEALFERLFALREDEPRDDLISALVTARGEGRIRPEELIPMCGLLLVAGFETTVNLIGNGVLALQRHRSQWQALVDDPALAPAVVEETLRWDPPVQRTTRVSFDGTEVGGVPVTRNQWVVVMIGGANRDPDVYERPDVFDVGRVSDVDHLAFSSGIHYCIGAPLARLEAQVAFAALASRMPRLTLAGKVTMRPSTTVRGPASIPVTAG